MIVRSQIVAPGVVRKWQVPDHSHQKSEVVFDGLSHSHTWTADNGPWMRLYHTHPVGSVLHRHDDLEADRHLLGAGQ